MKRFRRLRNVLLYGLPVLALLLLAAAAAARLYLSSEAVAAKVAGRLGDIFGGPVRVGEVDIGLAGDSTLKGLQVFPGDGSGKPWIEIADVEANVSALGLISGATPTDIHLQAPEVSLHLSSDNHLLTPLPELHATGVAVPQVDIRDGKFTIAQDGRPPLVASGLQGEVVPTAEGFRVQGSINDPYWGEWKIELSFETATKALRLRLDSGPTHVTMAKLRSLPVVSPGVWEEVQVDGTTPAVYTMTYRPAGPGEKSSHVHYRVELEPHDTTVHVSAINLSADQARGKVLIDDKVVTLTGVTGRTAEGEIRTDAVLDFRPADAKLDFNIDVQNVILHALPRTWRIPAAVDGKLTGHADLHVTVVKGHAVTRGQGAGQIADPRIGFLRPKKPLRLVLRADEKGFHFSQEATPVGQAFRLPGGQTGRLSACPTGALAPLWAVALVAPPPEVGGGG